MSWMNNWEEAAKHPRRTVITMSLLGLVGGGLLGYWRFGHSVGIGILLGLCFAVILGRMGWKTVRDPARVSELSQRRPTARPELRRAALRLGLLFAPIGVAFVAGLATASVPVFVITLAVGLVVGLVVRLFVLR